jgi:hypothetical protein
MQLQHITFIYDKNQQINNIIITFYHTKCITNKTNAYVIIQKLGCLIFLMFSECQLNLMFILCFFYHCIIHLELSNSSIHSFLKIVILSQSTLNQLELNSTNIIC